MMPIEITTTKTQADYRDVTMALLNAIYQKVPGAYSGDEVLKLAEATKLLSEVRF